MLTTSGYQDLDSGPNNREKETQEMGGGAAGGEN